MTAQLIERGFRVLALDARFHGARIMDIKPIERVKNARKGKVAANEVMIQSIVDV